MGVHLETLTKSEIEEKESVMNENKIKMTHWEKYVLASSLCPEKIYTKAMMHLLGKLDSLEEILDDYRGPTRKPLNDESRKLCKKIEKHEKAFYKLDFINNKRYYDYWDVTR